MKLKNFCCCVKISHGAIVIGLINIVNVVVALARFDIFGIVLKVFTAGCFVMMVRNDNRMWRLLFFCAYMTEVLIQYIIQGIVLYTLFS